MPSTGEINVLVIPVIVSDYQSNATEKVRSDIQKTLFGSELDTGYESLASYYKKSSHDQLKIKGTVSDWYNPNLSSSQMAKKEEEGEYTTTLLRNAISWYKSKYHTDLKDYDNNKDGFIDGVFLIYSAPDFQTGYKQGKTLEESLFWAYTTMDYEAEGNLTSPNGGYYFWASYDFMYEGYGKDSLDAHTFIHETGHMLSLDDYYSYNTIDKKGYYAFSPLGGIDMMDYNVIDQDCFSKFVLGWNEPYLIDKEGVLTLSLSSSLECAIIPTKDHNIKNPYDEYVMLELFSPQDELNYNDIEDNYLDYNLSSTLTKVGIRAYHVDNRVCSSKNISQDGELVSPSYDDLTKYDEEKYYVVAHSNTPDGYQNEERNSSYNYLNPKYRLITQLSKSGRTFQNKSYTFEDQDLFEKGDKFDLSNTKYTNQFPNKTKMNNGSELAYSFQVLSITNNEAKIQFFQN